MRTLKPVSSLVQTDCYEATFHLKDVYYSVNIFVLPNGSSCRIYQTKKVSISNSSISRIQSFHQIDEIITLHGVFENCLRTARTTIKLIQSLSFMIHPTKSKFIPRKWIILVLLLNRRKWLCLTGQKKKKIYKCRVIQKKPGLRISYIVRFIGTLTSTFPTNECIESIWKTNQISLSSSKAITTMLGWNW